MGISHGDSQRPFYKENEYMKIDGKYIWMDGKMLEFEKATIHFLNSALHYGLGVFEGIRCYDTERGAAIFRLPEHMKRLEDSAKILGFLQLPYTLEEMIDAARQVVIVNGFKECYIRPLIFHEDPEPSLNLITGYARLGIAAWSWPNFLGSAAMENGVRANVSSMTRHHINVMMTKAKITGNYANSGMAKTESKRLGFDEAIMLDPQGFVSECTGENIFLVRGNKIYTPPTTTILEGITRDSLITIAQDLGYTVIEQAISRDQLYISDEVFVCGTAAECVALREIDFRVIGSGKMGPVTRRIQQAYVSAIHGKHPRSAEWLDYLTP
jgi:branched-chain amino acid aminotransferase